MTKDTKPTDSEVFVGFHYPELKDLGKHFLTVASAVLAFSVTFADKFVVPVADYTWGEAALARWLLFGTWLLLLLAIATAGTGLYFNFRAGAAAKGNIIRRKHADFRMLTKTTYWLYHVAGGGLVLSLISLAGIGVLKILCPCFTGPRP